VDHTDGHPLHLLARWNGATAGVPAESAGCSGGSGAILEDGVAEEEVVNLGKSLLQLPASVDYSQIDVALAHKVCGSVLNLVRTGNRFPSEYSTNDAPAPGMGSAAWYCFDAGLGGFARPYSIPA
jgi:hypothetical protein